MQEATDIDSQALPEALLHATEPVLLRGLVAQWPAVQAARESASAADAYLRSFWRGATVGAWVGPPEIDGRFFYDDTYTGFNFRRELLKFDAVLDALARHADDAAPPALYVGSTTVDTCLPGFRAENDLGFGNVDPLMSLWLGNRARVAAHQDLPDNLACVVAGRRRFTLFPPDALPDLYIGPLDVTPAGQPVSLVDIARPDLQRFPRYAAALQRAQVAELGPGDAIFIPSLWWHHVEAMEPFNLLVNYWWRSTPAAMDTPMNALLLALMTVRDLPPAQRQAWRGVFEHYVFAADETTTAHIPADARGVLGPLDDNGRRMLRAHLLKALNR
ncbi:MAG: cupin-like domain-containing protein [Betaproteobacteria bacterium]|nr:cupin-like domain-containing protein [Betaproteobacteria bacterium]